MAGARVVPRLNPGVLQQWVTLSDEVPDGTPVTFTPARVKVGIRNAVQSLEAAADYELDCRYHPQITTNTCLTFDDGLKVYVRELTNKANADRSGWMTLRCQGADTP